ncbi:hypothetical protein H4R21_002631, partial [Coemansia helicoidea]
MFRIPYLSSCNHCREKKRKCNGEQPACSLCRAHNVPCEYRRSRRFRRLAAAGTPPSTVAIHAILPAPEPRAARPIAAAPPPASSAFAASIPPGEAQALTRLLAGNMFPQTQQLPQPILQGVNTFMSPFSDAHGQAIPEWISRQKPEADIISNLESIASAYSASPQAPLQAGAALDGSLLGSLTSQLMAGGSVLQPGPAGAINGQRLSYAGAPVGSSGAQSIHSILAQPATALPVTPVSGGSGGAFAQPGLGPGMAHFGASVSEAAAGWAHSPGSEPGPSPSRPGVRRSSLGTRSPLSTPLSEPDRPVSAHGPACGSAQQRHPAAYPEEFVPDVIRQYASEFPAALSPQVLLKVMRGICGTTRTSLINVDLELSWCMILKGVIPRILLFAYIASMARGQAIDPELKPLLPARFDELCYEVAVRDVPLAAASPALWGALSLHLLGRYEFQSARYDQMMRHYDMAYEIFTRIPFHGHPFPWRSVPDHLRHTFEYDYYVCTFWAGFQWHLVSSLNLDRPFNINIDPQMLPIPTSTDGYFAPEMPCEFDLLTLLPTNSWPRTAQTQRVAEVWFLGLDHPEFEGWRPPEWKEIEPNYKITVYLQRLLPLGAQLYRLQCRFSSRRILLAEYLRQLHAQQELLRRWLYSLPEDFGLMLARVSRFAGSEAARRSSGETRNLMMAFKELIMMYALYSTFMIRANRVALLGMLGEDVSAPATSMDMRVFGLRDYLDVPEQRGSGGGGGGGGSSSFGASAPSRWQKNLEFHKHRMHCY